MSIVDCILDSRLTEWVIVEVKYPTKNKEGDITVSSIFTETREEPKAYDNSRGFSQIFLPSAYEKARIYARKVAEELGIKACV